MNRRSNERIEMKLPCHLTFPSEWGSPVTGVTANMHRDGVLVSCNPQNLKGAMPNVGAKGRVQVELPANPAFTRKCIICDTTLVRVVTVDETETQFAMRIATVAFKDLSPDGLDLLPSNAPSASLSA